MVFLLPGVKFDLEMIQKYDSPVPRYTSYPPATELSEAFTTTDLQNAIAASNQRKTPLSLYFHIPFCQTACYFCGCNTVISNNKNIAKPYLEHLAQDIKQTAALIDSDRQVLQIHWGGGTPNYLDREQVEFVWQHITQHFTIDSKAEISIEINPRYVDKNYILFLRELGFNRISFGIQDFNHQVQVAINRVQPEEMLFDVMSWIREAEFESVNVDLIYGLPYQTRQSFRETVKKTIKLDPDRIVVFNFAYIPWIKPAQKNIPEAALPKPQEKLDILKMTIEELTNNEYLFIGMDHFAKSDDELAIAQRNGTLRRNFQGYTTHAETELFGFGATSISMLEDAYFQNHKQLKEYYQAISTGNLPLSKGIKLTQDDIIRRDVIMGIMSHFQLHKQDIADKYHICFDEYFAHELEMLKPLEADGLVSLSKNYILVTDIGRLLVRNIAVIFDNHMRIKEKHFSKAI
ncbi:MULTISPECIES: oxygen-independent coproporphyrinogen III oxidase [unclassified Tolypothrix]|uniref:oxygen-independent coproporphyrinogen III oxidase n=1 Tax=unclassified Tolypothrix TaxID=2649714 RepID=UPI0005EAC1B6|nr:MULTISPECIES: oxygen-independent coproporphyrinogen III oxidase [unclassified Tolypothrix]BAY90101.1 oxygen-independent coproporphyrinogen III oxidase [Microchaete diplosiphon NIES-3275]EKE97406.1 coproporphyrinogen dehydrogenase [Tolypothrix sp. PCC 7601]MBE9085020.1 oxygen-independent coproporphyrinogen III oxidase [Tolypothrix sp. LEGE 11397]UYD24319.1 oxygen-independent coproporphyrinogen III oxidase [Tolypothrix sp. PCC 7712]UYD33448.1 oxygen-independent coproporphyrinogen III oxidase 